MLKYILLVLTLLAGCSDPNPQPKDIPTGQIVAFENGYYVSEMRVKEIRLPDGTRCAVASGGYKGGISCDWKNP
jgi:hypothetical protein